MVHGRENFTCFAHHTTTRDGLQLANTVSLFAVRREVEPGTDASGLMREAAVSMNAYSLGKIVKRSDLREVLHQVPDSILGNDTLCHSVRPPSLLVELGQLVSFGEPDRQVVVQSAALLEFSNPDVAERHVLSLAPLADGL